MDFSIGNLVKGVVVALAKVATAVVNALSPVAQTEGILGSLTGVIVGVAAVLANVCEDGEISEDEEELLEEVFKLLVGAFIAKFSSELSNWTTNSNKETNSEFDIVTMFNNGITEINKGSAILTNALIKTSDSVKGRVFNALDDLFMPTTAVESSAVKLADGPLKKFGRIGGKAGIIGTVITPIMEYANSMEPYKDDLDAIAEYDPDNYEKYKKIAEVGAVADACTLGYVRGIINTPPTVAQLVPYYDNPEWTENWMDFVNENVNTRTIIEKTDEAFKDPVTGPKLKSFLRSDTLDQFKKNMKDDE